MKKQVVAAFLILVAAAAGALQSDKTKPIEIAADHFSGDQVSQRAVYTGRVEVHQGTLEMHGDRLDLQINAKGYRTGILTGRLATFKQQRDNPNPKISEWMHAEGEKLIYNEEKDTITIVNNGKLTRTENGVLKDEATGQTIVYDIRNARSVAEGGTAGGESRRVTTIIAPRTKDAQDTTEGDSANLRSSTTISPNTSR